MTFDELKDKANSLPLVPGVYIMRDKSDKVIYVGKAKKLKNRVSQYFQDTASHSPKTRLMVSHIDHFDVIVVQSEFEALVLENSLIKLQDSYQEAKLSEEELKAAKLEIDNAKAELSYTKTELKNVVGIRTEIIGELQSKFNNSSMRVDPVNGSITFSSDVLFEYGKATLTEPSKESLKEIIPIYLDVLLQDAYKDYIAEIIIEGHTDTSGSYKTNMELSTERAMAVAQFCLDKKNGLNEAQIARLQTMLTVNGRSFSSPVYKPNSQVIDMEASRRVEIKFRLKEDEMIEKIAEILGQ